MLTKKDKDFIKSMLVMAAVFSGYELIENLYYIYISPGIPF